MEFGKLSKRQKPRGRNEGNRVIVLIIGSMVYYRVRSSIDAIGAIAGCYRKGDSVKINLGQLFALLAFDQLFLASSKCYYLQECKNNDIGLFTGMVVHFHGNRINLYISVMLVTSFKLTLRFGILSLQLHYFTVHSTQF